MVPLLVSGYVHGIPMTLSVVLSSVTASTYDISQTLNGNLPSMLASDLGIPSLGV